LAMIFVFRRFVAVRKFVVLIIPVDRLFCGVAANRCCVHRAKLIKAGVRALSGVHPCLRTAGGCIFSLLSISMKVENGREQRSPEVAVPSSRRPRS